MHVVSKKNVNFLLELKLLLVSNVKVELAETLVMSINRLFNTKSMSYRDLTCFTFNKGQSIRNIYRAQHSFYHLSCNSSHIFCIYVKYDNS